MRIFFSAIIHFWLFNFVLLFFQSSTMTQIVIDKKKYVLIPEKDYKVLRRRAALKSKAEKTFSVSDARAHSKKLIRKWASGK